MTKSEPVVAYPYIDPKGTIQYVDMTDTYMAAAKQTAKNESLDKAMPTGAVVVKDGKVIGRGANGSTYHETHVCERVRLNIPTGQGYELCEGCSPQNHAEPKAINAALGAGNDTVGASVYLWGHWWCCEPCWDAMMKNGIANVYLLARSDQLFNKESPLNVVGKQFA